MLTRAYVVFYLRFETVYGWLDANKLIDPFACWWMVVWEQVNSFRLERVRKKIV